MSSKFLMKIRRKNTISNKHETNIGYIKEALIESIRPLYGTEIVDVDIEGLNTELINVTYYTKKGQSKTKKD